MLRSLLEDRSVQWFREKGRHRIEPGDPQERRWIPLLQSGLVSPEHKSGNQLFGNRSEFHKGSRPPYIQHLLNPHDDPNQINYQQEKTTNWLLLNGHKQVGNDTSDEPFQDS